MAIINSHFFIRTLSAAGVHPSWSSDQRAFLFDFDEEGWREEKQGRRESKGFVDMMVRIRIVRGMLLIGENQKRGY